MKKIVKRKIKEKLNIRRRFNIKKGFNIFISSIYLISVVILSYISICEIKDYYCIFKYPDKLGNFMLLNSFVGFFISYIKVAPHLENLEYKTREPSKLVEICFITPILIGLGCLIIFGLIPFLYWGTKELIILIYNGSIEFINSFELK